MKVSKRYITQDESLLISFVMVSACLIVYTTSQERPQKCIAKPDVMYRTCCIQPPYFTREVARQCGAGFELLLSDRDNNITGYRRYSYTDCGHWYCILDKYALITNGGFVDHEKFFAHLDVWVSLNPPFSKVMISAKRTCAQSHRSYFPLKPCEFFNLLICVRNYINVECPVIVPTDECREQRAFFRDCEVQPAKHVKFNGNSYFYNWNVYVNAPNEKIIDIYAPRISRCIGSPELLYRFCCIIPPFFTQDTARKCGSRSEPVVFGKNITGLVRYLYDCSYWYCSLNIYELLTPKGFVDIDKYFVHLDLWANLNTAFRDHIIDAKVQCKQSHRYYLPLKPCEFFNMNQCIRNYLKVKCPVPIQTKECIVQKKFFDECGDYFI